MQPFGVPAFRKRIKSLGYADIHIKRISNKDETRYNEIKYMVSAVEPLSGQRVSCVYSLDEINNSMHRHRLIKSNHRPTRTQVDEYINEISGQLTFESLPTNK